MRGKVTSWKSSDDANGGFGFIVASGMTYFVRQWGIADDRESLDVGSVVEFTPMPSRGGLTMSGKEKYPLARDVRVVVQADRSRYLPGETVVVTPEEKYKTRMC